MAKVDVQPPFEAYRGSDPYIFVSYSHRDARVVFAELSRLSLWGLNVWYDEGIDPGNEWPKEIAAAIGRSSLFLYFVSPQSVGSVNCRNEVYYALSLKKHFLCIHLEQTNIQEIDAGLALSIGTLQAVMKYSMTEMTYETKLRRALELLSESKITLPPVSEATPPVPVVATVPQVTAPAPVATSRPRTSSGSQAILLGAGIGAVVLSCFAAGGFYLIHTGQNAQAKVEISSQTVPDLTSQLSAQTTSTPPTPSPTDSPAPQVGATQPNPFQTTTPVPVNSEPAPAINSDSNSAPLFPPPPPGPNGPLGLAEKLREAHELRRPINDTNSAPLPPPPPPHIFGQ